VNKKELIYDMSVGLKQLIIFLSLNMSNFLSFIDFYARLVKPRLARLFASSIEERIQSSIHNYYYPVNDYNSYK
jgi:hypothetical protein